MESPTSGRQRGGASFAASCTAKQARPTRLCTRLLAHLLHLVLVNQVSRACPTTAARLLLRSSDRPLRRGIPTQQQQHLPDRRMPPFATRGVLALTAASLALCQGAKAPPSLNFLSVRAHSISKVSPPRLPSKLSRLFLGPTLTSALSFPPPGTIPY